MNSYEKPKVCGTIWDEQSQILKQYRLLDKADDDAVEDAGYVEPLVLLSASCSQP